MLVLSTVLLRGMKHPYCAMQLNTLPRKHRTTSWLLDQRSIASVRKLVAKYHTTEPRSFYFIFSNSQKRIFCGRNIYTTFITDLKGCQTLATDSIKPVKGDTSPFNFTVKLFSFSASCALQEINGTRFCF